MKEKEKAKILLAHGGGGQLSDELIRGTILAKLQGQKQVKLYDSANLETSSKSICFTTDSYVVKPLFFNGGDIGKLSVCGTINDLAVCGARPTALSLSLIIETGLEMETLERILESIRKAADENKVSIVTGDTKTVERGEADKIFINTSGIGIRLDGVELSFDKIEAGDKIILSGTIGDHGMTIISQRKGISFESKLQSDCASIAEAALKLLEESDGVKFMRDPTRGGLAATLNEISRETGLSIEIQQTAIPVKAAVQAAADMFGFDVLNVANEGKFVAVVSAQSAEKCLEVCRENPLARDANIIGEIVKVRDVPTVEIVTSIGGRRIVQMPYGEQLPRIC
jgi:hydrogenase expression/formation protein HypE